MGAETSETVWVAMETVPSTQNLSSRKLLTAPSTLFLVITPAKKQIKPAISPLLPAPLSTGYDTEE